MKINSSAYLIHAKDKTKYQYSSEMVETFGTINYDEFIRQNKEDFDKRAATAKCEQSDIGLDYVLKEIQQGCLTYRDVMIDEKLAFLYDNNQEKFKDAFNFFGERQSWLRLEELRNKEYELTVIYIQGKPEIGKTTLANELTLETRSLLMANGYKSDIYLFSWGKEFF